MKRNPPLIISIGIPVYNEAENIRELAESILAQKNFSFSEVIFIASGCTDNSIAIVKQFMEKDARFKLLEESSRNGKASAVNLFLRNAHGDIYVLLSSDIILDEYCLSLLTKPLVEERVGMTGAHVIPVQRSNNFICLLNRIIWELTNQFNVNKPKLGEAVAFKNIINEIPHNTAVDEASIEAFFVSRGYKLRYAEKALVYNKCPITIQDLFIQRTRIFWGHLDAKAQLGYAVGSMDLKQIAKVVFAYARRKLRLLEVLCFLCVLEAIIRLFACFKYFFNKKSPPFIWPAYKKG